MEDKLNKGIGTKEAEKLQAKPVEVLSVRIEEPKKKDGSEIKMKTGDKISDKVILGCKHPDKEEVIFLSGVRYEKDNSIKTSALWYNEDEEGLIRKTSALAICMKFFNVTTLMGFTGKTINTTLDERGYLVIKAY